MLDATSSSEFVEWCAFLVMEDEREQRLMAGALALALALGGGDG